ncbi:MAG: methylmalonyl-CoA mutase family protein [Hyphomicrobiales bacterium]
MPINKSPVFEEISQSDSGTKWLDLLAKTQRGSNSQDLFERLGTLTLDDIRLDPIYPLTSINAQDGTSPFRTEKAWKTLTRIDIPDPQSANKQLLDDLEQGADGAVIVLKGAASAFGFGVTDNGTGFFDALLNNVFVEATNLRFEGFRIEHLEAWSTFCKSRNYASNSLSTSLGINEIAVTTSKCVVAPPSRFAAAYLTADGADWHNRGASAVQELGFTLSQLVEALRSLLDTGLDGPDAATLLDAKLGCDADQFETLSKFRAMRQLWGHMLEASGIAHVPLSLHAETSWRMMSRRDPWTNILRSTVASFSAGLGGADSIAILPHTQALGLPDAFARRVVRNTSLVLQEESYLNHVIDPAAGAGLYDSFSASLADEAWQIFQQVELMGGWNNALLNGLPIELTNVSQEKRLHEIKTRKKVTLGNSHFPKLDEKAVEVLIELPLEKSGSLIQATLTRDSLPFEQLASRAAVLGADTSPKVALICIGNANGYKPRESFASDYFAAAGLTSITHALPIGGNVLDLDTQSTPIVCLCGSDEDYSISAVEVLSELQSSGAKFRLVAGRGDFSGADAHIFLGNNAHETLESIIALLEGSNQ